METNKTMVCPNCGAATTNLDKCEYCGSILVKIASALVPSSGDVKSELKNLGFGKTVYVNHWILNRLEMSISQSAKLNREVLCTMGSIDFTSSPASSPRLSLYFDMDEAEENNLFRNFEDSEISKIFEVKQGELNYMCASIDLDNDTRTIAQIIQYSLHKIYNSNDAGIEAKVGIYLNSNFYQIENEETIEKYNSLLKKSFEEEYRKYIENITMKNYGWDLYIKEYYEGIYDKGLYDIVYADPILRCKVDDSYKDNVDIDLRLELSKRVIWSSEESKQKYIAKCKEICGRSYFWNIFLEKKYIFLGVLRKYYADYYISENYNPQESGPIDEYIKRREENIIKQFEEQDATDVDKIINEMQERHEVISNSGCVTILIPIFIVIGILGYIIF